MADDGPRPAVGSVAEETARLLDALLGDAQDGSGVPAAETRRQDSRPEPDACPTCGHTPGPSHTADASAEVCQLCPVCQLLRVVRAVRPETLDRLADLAGAVTEALRDAAASRWRETGSSAPKVRRPTVEDIDVTDVDTDEGRAVTELLAVGIDIGGTKVAGGAVDSSGRVLCRARRDTPHRSKAPDVVEDTIVAVVDEIVAGVSREGLGEVVAVGIGAAGFVAADRATVVFAPHLSWRHEPLRDALSRRVRMPITVDNDANAAAWAEWKFGAAQGETHLVIVNLGTGIGGGFVIDGRVQRGRFGIAGEFGHMQVVPNGLRCECGNKGCWEQYASGNALVREARDLIAARSPVANDLLAAAGGDPAKLTGPLITAAAQAGDPLAVELLAEIGTWLGVGIANLAAAFDPGTFVIGGGVSAAGPLLLDPARETFRRQLTGRGYRPEALIVAAELGNEAGLIGAADLARLGQ